MQNTCISDLLKDIRKGQEYSKDSQENFDISKLDIDEAIEEFHNGANSVGQRRQIFQQIQDKNPQVARECITDLCRNFQDSGSQDLLNFICFILDYVEIDFFARLECTMILHGFVQDMDNEMLRDKMKEKLNLYMINLLERYGKFDEKEKPSMTVYTDVLKILVCNTEDELRVISCIHWYLKESRLAPEFLYKSIKSLQNNDDKPNKLYLDILFLEFFQSTPSSKYKILSSQYLLSDNYGDIENKNNVQQQLLEISKSKHEEYNIRADAADTLLRLGTATAKEKARKIIEKLGESVEAFKSVYTNRQNIHNMDASVSEFLVNLGGTNLETIKTENGERCINLQDTITSFFDHINAEGISAEKVKQINGSLLRIKLDQLLYPGSQTLETIFVKIYTQITKHPDKDLLLERLVEELVEMDETCSSGHASRLVNVFSGIDDFNINVGFQAQIQANIMGRLQKLLREDDNSEAILEEMGEVEDLSDEKRKVRRNFDGFLRDNIDGVYKEMFEEFVTAKYLAKENFEAMFREGISFFETGTDIVKQLALCKV